MCSFRADALLRCLASSVSPDSRTEGKGDTPAVTKDLVAVPFPQERPGRSFGHSQLQTKETSHLRGAARRYFISYPNLPALPVLRDTSILRTTGRGAHSSLHPKCSEGTSAAILYVTLTLPSFKNIILCFVSLAVPVQVSCKDGIPGPPRRALLLYASPDRCRFIDK